MITREILAQARIAVGIADQLVCERLNPSGWGGGTLEITGASPDKLRSLGRYLAGGLGCRYAEPGDPTFARHENDEPSETGLFFNGEALAVHPGRYHIADFAGSPL